MKLTAEQIKSILGEDGEVDQSKLDAINKDVSDAQARAFTKGKGEAQKIVPTTKPTVPASDIKHEDTLMAEIKSLKEQMAADKKFAEDEKRKSAFIARGKAANVDDKILSHLADTTAGEHMDEYNFEMLAKIQVADMGAQKNKSDASVDNNEAKQEQMLKNIRENRH